MIRMLDTPIELDSLVIRAWKTNPKSQFELGKVIQVREEHEDYLIHGDVRIEWAFGGESNELFQELHHVEVYR